MSHVQAIGVFDSGIGGMTVVKELFDVLPHERIVYFGDTARLPYGSKSVETVQRFAREDTELLVAQEVKMIVVACNTVSATAMREVESAAHGKPVIGMIEPAAREAVRVTSSGKIGIIGTEATVASGAYERALANEAVRQDRAIQTLAQACPLFVPFAEEGWTDREATRLVAEEYLSELKQQGVDTLILGCTHYPVLQQTIQLVMGAGVKLINSGAVAAREVQNLLALNATEIGDGKQIEHLFLVSDVPRKFQRMGEQFLGRQLPEARQVVFKESWVIHREPITV
jgi:glutamate racemase